MANDYAGILDKAFEEKITLGFWGQGCYRACRLAVKPNLQKYKKITFTEDEIERRAKGSEIANNIWKKRKR